MFELKITTNTAAEARQDLEQFLGQAIPGQLLTIDAGDPAFDEAVDKRVAEIDARVKKEVQEMHAENQRLEKELAHGQLTIKELAEALGKYQAAEIEAKMAQQDQPDRKEVKRSHKAKPKAADPEETAAQVIQGSANDAPPWIPEATALPDPVPAIDGATVRRALADLAEAKGRAALEKILADFQADKFSKLDPTSYPEVLQAIAQVMK